MKTTCNAQRRRVDARAHRSGLRAPPAAGCAACSARLLVPQQLSPRPGSARSCHASAPRFALFNEEQLRAEPGDGPAPPSLAWTLFSWFLFLFYFLPPFTLFAKLSDPARSVQEQHLPRGSPPCSPDTAAAPQIPFPRTQRSVLGDSFGSRSEFPPLKHCLKS